MWGQRMIVTLKRVDLAQPLPWAIIWLVNFVMTLVYLSLP